MDEQQPVTSGGAGATVSLTEGRQVLAAATTVLRALIGVLWQANGADLGDVLGELDAVTALAAAGRVAVAAEALERGEVAASQYAGTAAWIAGNAPSLATGGAGQVAKLVERTRRPVTAPVRDAVVAGRLGVPAAMVVLAEFHRLWDRVLPDARAAVLTGLIEIGSSHGPRAVRMLRARLLAVHGDPDERELAAERAARQVALSQPAATDEEGAWDYVLRVDAEAKALVEAAIGPLSAPQHGDGARDPRSTTQRRGQALIEVCRRVTALATAAGPYGGHPRQRTMGDPESPYQPYREPRACQEPVRELRADNGQVADGSPGGDRCVRDDRHRAVGSGGSGDGGSSVDVADGQHDCGVSDPGRSDGDPPAGAGDGAAGRDEREWWDPRAMAAALAGAGAGGNKATLLVTIPWDALRERAGYATVLGSTEQGDLLTPGTARRIACDAGIIPVVLGTAGEMLDLGRTARLFSPSQAKAVLLRDRHCSFPECDIPGFWTQLHHVQHWADGGETDIGNAALLCARHHTIVHRDRLTATVTPTGVRWDTTYGSYDRTHPSARDPAA
ncbi:MAG: HNH endonuclease [Dermatophilaceae bacterium]